MVIDFATSVVPWGKVEVCAARLRLRCEQRHACAASNATGFVLSR